jgi:Flp pilus assembly protein TadD
MKEQTTQTKQGHNRDKTETNRTGKDTHKTKARQTEDKQVRRTHYEAELRSYRSSFSRLVAESHT